MITSNSVAAPGAHNDKLDLGFILTDGAASAWSTNHIELPAAADSVPANQPEQDAWMQGLTFSAPGRETWPGVGGIYATVVELLQARGFVEHKKLKGTTNLFLGGCQGNSIDWKRLGSMARGWRPITNYFRGHKFISKKVAMAKMLRNHCDANLVAFDTLMPRTFLFYPAKPELSEKGAFLAACRVNPGWTWILKPSDGAKGANIEIMRDPQAIIAFFVGVEKPGAVGWVVQRYIDNPLLLPLQADALGHQEQAGGGGRKFDIRCWVMLTHDYRVFFFNRGVLRTCCEPWSMLDLTENGGNKTTEARGGESSGSSGDVPGYNVYAHLSNHCIQTSHPDYGRVDATSDTNEVMFDAFAALFDGGDCISGKRGNQKLNTDGGSNFADTILPQMKRITVETLLAARERVSVSETATSTCAQLFGYDFMIDDDMAVSLLEINSSPATADHLRQPIAEQFFAIGFERYFAEQMGMSDRAAEILEGFANASDDKPRFEQIHAP